VKLNNNGVGQVISKGIADNSFPGACWAYGTSLEQEVGAMGHFTYSNGSPLVSIETLWDLASLTKVIATTSVAMVLYDKNELNLYQPIAELLPEFGVNGKEHITPLHLLYHCSGLVAFRDYELNYSTPDEVIKAILSEPIDLPIGKYNYSDLNFIILARYFEQIRHTSFDQIVSDLISRPFGLGQMMFCPGLDAKVICAPTERINSWRVRFHEIRGDAVDRFAFKDESGMDLIQGEVHDERALALGGIAGHAGLFSTIADLTRFTQALLTGCDGVISNSTKQLFTDRQKTPNLDREKSSRLLGWDGNFGDEPSSAGTMFSPSSFGHTGFTGTSIWIDPIKDKFAILLTNRVCPTRENLGIIELRKEFANASATAFE